MRMIQEQSAKSDTSLPDIQPAMSPPLVSPIRDNAFSGVLVNRGFEPSPLLSMEVVEKHLGSFFTHKYRSLQCIIYSARITNLLKLFSQFWTGIDYKIL
jgi:hypothetical protein